MSRPILNLLIAAVTAVLAGGPGGIKPCSGAEIDHEVASNMAKGRTQRVIIHLASDDGTKDVLQSEPGIADENRLRAVEAVVSSAINHLGTVYSDRDVKVVRRFRLQAALTADVTATAMAVLAEDSRIRRVEPDRRWELQTLEGLQLIGADTLHDLGIAGEGTAVAIIDSGIDPLHPTLGGGQIPNAKVVYGRDTADGDDDPSDCTGHGTAVASVAAGSSYQWSPNRRFAGGVAPAAKILAYKVTSDSDCRIATTSAVVEAIEDAVLRRQSDDYRLAAINISLGGGDFSGPCDIDNHAYSQAINIASEAGITVVAASGNTGSPDGLNVPACLTRTISVGSAWDVNPGWVPFSFCLDADCTDICDDSFRWQGSVACYSNSGAYLDLIAPSEYLRAAAADAVTLDFGGTSGAAAYVTGAAALLAQAVPGIDPTTTKFLLAATGRPTMDDKNGLIRPIVDLAAAIDAAGRVVVAEDSPLAIEPGSGSPLVSTLFVNRVGKVGTLKALVHLAHPKPDHLRLTLSAPDGTEVILHDHQGGPDGISGTYPDDLTPFESLGRFSGGPMQGLWSLKIEDDRAPDAAAAGEALVGWALRLEEPSSPPFQDTTMVFPVVAHTEGAQDTDWRSDVRIFNAASWQETEVRLILVPPPDETNMGSRQADVIVPHDSTIALDDLVKTRFGLESAQGTLLVQDPSHSIIHGTSRTYTTGPSGTFGQFIAPQVAGLNSTGAGDPAVIVLPTAGIDHRVNIGITEVTGQPATVAVTLIESETGTALAPSTFHLVEPHSNIQLNGVLPDPDRVADADPYIAVAVVKGPGRVTAYGSVIDNRTGDAVFITGDTPEVTPYLLIPVVANNEGHGGTEWRTDLRVLNHGSFSVHVDAELRFQGALGIPAVTESITLQPGQAVTINDVVGELFGFNDAVGSLRLVPREGPAAICATSRTANHGLVGTYGQYVPALTGGDGLRERGVVLHLAKGSASRSNLGIVETNGKIVGVQIRLFDDFGRELGSSTRMNLGPFESVQINDIFGALGAEENTNARVEVTRDTGDGAFFAYASVIDADSGDAIFVPVLKLPN